MPARNQTRNPCIKREVHHNVAAKYSVQYKKASEAETLTEITTSVTKTLEHQTTEISFFACG